MVDYVADTHSLLWYFTRPNQLGTQARAAFREVDARTARLLIPVIVLAELVFVAEASRVQIDIESLWRQLSTISNVEFVKLTAARAYELRHLTAIPEMHDRLIVAEALAHNAALITRDQTIIASGLVSTLW
jgi:PIN domain nuclease of toxin-antitoxin system